jgi:DNA-binding IclR family transcriptional regulator
LPTKTVLGLRKGLDVLLCFDAENNSRTARELASELGLPLSTVYRYLETLVDTGFLLKSTEKKTYKLGFVILHLANLVSSGIHLVSTARPHMRFLSSTCGETTLLTVLSGSRAICIESLESNHRVKLALQLGVTLPLHAGAAAKCLLAFQEEEFIAGFISDSKLESHTKFTETDPVKLQQHLGTIRLQRYAFTDQEVDLGAAAVAAPITDAQGSVTASLTIAGPRQRIVGRRRELAKMVMDTAALISRELGFVDSESVANRHAKGRK